MIHISAGHGGRLKFGSVSNLISVPIKEEKTLTVNVSQKNKSLCKCPIK